MKLLITGDTCLIKQVEVIPITAGLMLTAQVPDNCIVSPGRPRGVFSAYGSLRFQVVRRVDESHCGIIELTAEDELEGRFVTGGVGLTPSKPPRLLDGGWLEYEHYYLLNLFLEKQEWGTLNYLKYQGENHA